MSSPTRTASQMVAATPHTRGRNDIVSGTMSAPTPSPPFDPRTMLAMSMHASPGVYALLVGSGISMGAGVLTGWGVIVELVRRMAATDTREEPGADFDVEEWWKAKYPGVDLGYGSVLEASGMSPLRSPAVARTVLHPRRRPRT